MEHHPRTNAKSRDDLHSPRQVLRWGSSGLQQAYQQLNQSGGSPMRRRMRLQRTDSQAPT